VLVVVVVVMVIVAAIVTVAEDARARVRRNTFHYTKFQVSTTAFFLETASFLKTEPACPETSGANHDTPRNIPKQRKSQITSRSA
jgi:type II secretory pathway component PulK